MEKNGLISSYWNFQIILSSWKLQKLVPAIEANKLVWKDTKMGMSLLIRALPSLLPLSMLVITQHIEHMLG
ncbi:hypothetical protein SCA6_000972 [Theobroma cacao]